MRFCCCLIVVIREMMTAIMMMVMMMLCMRKTTTKIRRRRRRQVRPDEIDKGFEEGAGKLMEALLFISCFREKSLKQHAV